MIRILLHRLFGLGKIPAGERKALETEGIKASYEGVSGSLTYRNYRAPGKIFIGRRRWFIGSLAITGQRFVAYAYSRRLVSVPLGDTSLAKLKIFVEDGQRLCLSAEASDFDPNQSGILEFRFTIPDAGNVARLLGNTA